MSPQPETRSEATFLDRLANFIELTNPFYLIYSEKDVEWARNAQDANKPAADRILRVATHPDSGETIPRPFRLNGIIPMNVIISMAMVHPAVMLSVARSATVHWLNQTYSCALNFANRNASSEVNTSVLAQTYVAACSLSVSIALAATLIMKRYSPTGWKLTAVRAFFPMLAASTASVANVAMIRRSEWIDDGVNVFDENNEFHGKSLHAGSEGIFKCGVTRALSNIPIITMPVLLTAWLTRYRAFRPTMRLEIACVLLGVSCGIPACWALFPQRETVPVARLEKRFQDKFLQDGQTPISLMYYNKGL